MTTRALFLCGVAAFTLAACGNGGTSNTSAPETKSSARAGSAGAPSPIDAPFRLKDGTEVDVARLLAVFPDDARPTYASATFDDAIGATVLTDLKFASEDGDAVTVERAEIFGANLDGFDRVKVANEAGAAAPFETLFEKVRLFGVKPVEADANADDAADVVIGAVEIDRLRVRQGAAAIEEDSPAHVFNAFDLAGLYFKDVAVDAKDEESSGAVTFRAPDIRVVGLGGGKVSAVILNDVRYDLNQSAEDLAALAEAMGPQGGMLVNGPLGSLFAPGAQSGAVNAVEWRGIDLSGLVEAGLKDEDPAYTAKNLVNLGRLEFTGLSSTVNGKLAYKSDRQTFTAEESVWIVPSKVRAESSGDFYDLTAYLSEEEEALRKIFVDNGLDKINSKSNMTWDWDSAKGDAVLASKIDADGVADIAMSLNLAGLEMDKLGAAMDADDDAAAAALAKFAGFSLTLDDEKILDALFAAASLQMGGSASDLRQSAPAMIRLGGAQAAQFNPRIQTYIDAVANFVAKGGSVEIKAAPAAPVSFADIEATGETSPQTLPDLVNLTVVHKE